MKDQWLNDISKMRNTLYDFAEKNNFDPLISTNWYSLFPANVRSIQVELLYILNINKIIKFILIFREEDQFWIILKEIYHKLLLTFFLKLNLMIQNFFIFNVSTKLLFIKYSVMLNIIFDDKKRKTGMREIK